MTDVTKKEYYDFREEDNTRQVNLMMLLRVAFKKWMLILAAGVLLGMLLGGYKIISIHSNKASMIEDYENYRAKNDAYKQSQEDYRETVSELQRTIASRKDYYSNSTLMQLNPYSVATCSVNLNISAPAGVTIPDSKINTIRASISNEILTGDTIKNAAAKAGVTSQDLRDMTTAQTPNGNSIVRVTVRALTEEQASQIMETILEGVEAKHKTMAANLGEFVCTPYNLSTSTIPDNTIATAQDKFTDSLSKLETAAYTAQNQSSQLARPEPSPQYSKKYMLVNGMKLGIIGFIGGVILAIAALIGLAIAKGTIFTKDEIDGEYALLNLADLAGKDAAGQEQKTDYIIAQLENLAKDAKQLGLTGFAGEEKKKSLAQILGQKAAASGNGFKFTQVGNLLEDAEALRALSGIDGMILVEEIGKSPYMSIRQELAVLAESGCRIIGTIYF